jgi:hypothetical protein
MSMTSTHLSKLKEGLLLACQPTGITLILQGREQVLALPREFVLANIESLAANSLDLSDYWEYRRLLELAKILDFDLLQRLVAWGLVSTDPDVLEAAMDNMAPS